MRLLKISLALVLQLSFFNLNAAELSKLNLTITTFNVRFYGLYADEKRDPYLQDFLKNSIPASDLIVFEEIVDVPRIKTLLPENWDCLSYEAPRVGHQHVVLCHSARFNFVREATDDNDVIDEVAGENGTLRPAVTTIVTDLEGNKLFRLVGVHLKATPEYSKLRVAQSEMISNYLGKLKESNLPIIIAGDFNTFKSPANKESSDDIDLIENAFNSTGLGIHRIPNNLFTFRNSYGQGQFDQFYISNTLNVVKPLKIFEICNAETSTGDGLSNLEYYYKNISDHCPVSAEISI